MAPVESFEVRDGSRTPTEPPTLEIASMRMVFRFTATDTGSQVAATTWFDSVEDLDPLIAMGMEQGVREAMGEMDAVMADLATFAIGRAVEAQLLSDTRVRVSRIIRGTVEQVWEAHHDPALMQRWLLGPEGWTMPVCEVAAVVGEHYRYEWESVDGSQRFGFTGELTESTPPHRAVTTEQMIGMDGPGTTNEMTLTPVEGGTLLSIVITSPSAEVAHGTGDRDDGRDGDRLCAAGGKRPARSRTTSSGSCR